VALAVARPKKEIKKRRVSCKTACVTVSVVGGSGITVMAESAPTTLNLQRYSNGWTLFCC
jgi:hypothetical protein